MSPKEEAEKIQNQYSKQEWSILLKDDYFREVWEFQDFIKAQEIANILLEGNARNRQHAKVFKEVKKSVKDYLNGKR